MDAGRTNVLGLQIPRRRIGETGGFFEHFTLELADAARQRNQHVLIFSADDEGAAEHSRLHRARLVDGVVIADTTVDDRRIDELVDAGIPFVAFGRTASEKPYPWVDVDNRLGGELCVRHLLDRGHRRIGYLDRATSAFYANERTKGLREALAASEQSWLPRLAVTVGEDLGTARSAVESMLGQAEPPTAIVAGSDLLAATVVDVARRLGIPIGPNGLALIGFDDTPLASLLNPPITTVRQPIKEIAIHAVDLLLDRIAGRPVENRLVKPTLDDAGRIDGLGTLGIFSRIALPVAWPAIAAQAIFIFVWNWTTFVFPSVVATSPEMFTLPVGIYQLTHTAFTDHVAQSMAGVVLTTVPALVVFAILQRRFIETLAGVAKG